MDLNAAPFEFAVYRQGATAPGSRSPELKAFTPGHFEERMCDEKSYCPLFTSHREHHFAEVFAAFEIALRSASFRQRECLVDNHFKLSIADQL
jgi:hypothetical protein